MSGWRHSIVLGVATLIAAGCGGSTASVPEGDGGQNGAIHVAWVLENASGSPTDCITANTPNIGIDVTTASQTPVLSTAYYCVDMKETLEGFAPGHYSIKLSLHGPQNVAAVATGAATVTAGGTAQAGTLTLILAGP